MRMLRLSLALALAIALMASPAAAAESFITLCYHDIPESPVERDDISQKDFINQIEYLRTHGFTFVSPADILAASQGRKDASRKGSPADLR